MILHAIYDLCKHNILFRMLTAEIGFANNRCHVNAALMVDECMLVISQVAYRSVQKATHQY